MNCASEISADILGHWMDLLNSEGWIPREQILGMEARAKVPDEFVVQHNKNANPPTLLLTLHSLVRDMPNPPAWFRDYLLRMWPRLEKWYEWFNTTQMGKVPGTFRWVDALDRNLLRCFGGGISFGYFSSQICVDAKQSFGLLLMRPLMSNYSLSSFD